MLILVSGVSGSGKSTVGAELARQLGWTFLDADDDHPPANIEKMRSGVALTDEDRRPWLEAVRERVRRRVDSGHDVVLACSALKRAYRDYLIQVNARVAVVQLAAPERTARSRIATRSPHFMAPTLLRSQYEILEAEDAIVVDATASVQEIVAAIRAALGL